MLEIHTSSDPQNDAANALIQLLKINNSKELLILFSGGSALGLVAHIRPEILSGNCTVSVLDERYSFDEEESNFSKLTHSALFKEAHEHNITFIDPRPQQDESLEATAKRFDLALKHWHILHPHGVVIATLGIGPDGHTGGILPMPENKTIFKKLFLDEKMCAVGYEITPDKNPYTKRITTTLTYLLRHVSHAVVFAIGTPKRDAIHQTLTSQKEYAEFPATVLQKMHDVHLYTDVS